MRSDEFKIRKLTPADLNQIKALHKTREDIEQPEGAMKRTELLEWLAFNNPFTNNGEATYFVAEDAGKVVAYHGRMPMEFVVNGKRKKGYFMHDLYVHPEYRSDGMGFWLAESFAKTLEEQSDSFFCHFGGTKLNAALQKRMGYYELPPADIYIKILNPRKYLTGLFRKTFLVNFLSTIFSNILHLIDRILFRVNSHNLQISRVEKFDSRFDEFNQSILSQIGISSYKNSEYLNWKYVDRPFRRDAIFAAMRKGKIEGYIVAALSPFDKGYPVGVIVDIMAAPDDTKTIRALCRAAIEHFRTLKVDSIGCILSDKRFVKVFKRFLFYKGANGKTVLLGNLEKCDEDREYLTNISNWHFTRGESDSFMLSP